MSHRPAGPHEAEPRVVDLSDAGTALISVLQQISSADLERPTPCSEFTVAALLEHLREAVESLAAAAEDGTREPRAEPTDDPPDGSPVLRLIDDVDRLVDARRHSSLHDQDHPSAGGATTPTQFHNGVALQELLIHAWDLAAATGQTLVIDQDTVRALLRFLREHKDDDIRDGSGRPPFDEAVDVGPDTPPFHQVLGLTGRDPTWRSPAG